MIDDNAKQHRLPVPLNEEMTRTTIRSLVGRVEGVAFVIQAFAIFSTINADKLSNRERALLYGVAGAHLAVAVVTAKVGGPFFRGGPWPFLWLAMVFAMPLLIANMVPPGDYGISPVCPQLCGYPVSPVAIAAFYPWIGNQYNYLGMATKTAVALAISLEPLALMALLNGHVTPANLQGTLAQAIMVGGMWAAGEAIGRICRRAAASQAALLRREYNRQFGYLHSDIETGMRVAEMHYSDNRPKLVLEALNDLAEAVLEERLRLSLAQDYVSVADIIRLHVRRVRSQLEVNYVSAVDVTYVPQETADLLSRALGDLLKNALTNFATSVAIDFQINDRELQLDVSDDGPGISRTVLLDATTSLHALRQGALLRGGDLCFLDTVGSCLGGTTARLSLPIGGK